MAGVVLDLKAQARILHRQVLNGTTLDAGRAKRLAALCDCELSALPVRVRRRHCLTVIAKEFGFRGWPHAAAVLQGTESNDFGTLLYPEPGGAQWNIWSASYREAAAIRAEHGGYLLAYQRQFFIADRYFVETLGLDPDDPDWELIGRDWVRPRLPAARDRLYGKLVRHRAEQRVVSAVA